MDRESFANRRACDTDRSAIERALKRPRRAQTVTFCPSIQHPSIAPGISPHPDCACDWPPPLPCVEAVCVAQAVTDITVILARVSILSVSCYFGTFCCRWGLALRFAGVAFVFQATVLSVESARKDKFPVMPQQPAASWAWKYSLSVQHAVSKMRELTFSRVGWTGLII